MFLRSLSIRGFKSFADRTTLEFTPGISVIVGPNGSGKSNIVDAISWVLGEQGPRALRGGQMADVIFAGSPGRPQLGMAEVKLVIDNSSGLIPVPLTEIEISRAIFRSGDSEYRIGGQTARLLDIQELLADSGIGRALHTVVGQGQLEDALTARPEERRQYIEEAAGIAKHRRRKERAQRKLGGLEQDLLRLQDVLGELRRQLRPLKQQAEMAERHEKLSAEADELAWRLAAARLRALQADRQTRSGGWRQGLELRETARRQLDALDARLAELSQERGETARGLHESEAARRAAEDARANAERELRLAAERASEARTRLAQAAASSSRLESVARDLDRAGSAHAETIAALEDRERELAAAEEEFHARERARRDAEDERRRLTEEAVAHRAEVETLQRSLASSDRERERLEASLAEIRARVARSRDERERLEAEIERLDAEETPLAERQGDLEREREVIATEISDLDERLRGLDHRRALLEARRRDLEETPGSRFVESHPGRAVGLLCDLVRAEPGFEQALAAALGSLSDAVVYEDSGHALEDASGGDGAVLGLAAEGSPTPSLAGERPLLSVVRPDPKARAFLKTALRDVYLADSLSEAAQKHERHPRCAFVTAEGVLVGPAVIRTAAEGDARAEALRVELLAVERDLASARNALKPRNVRLAEVMDEVAAVRGELERADAAITAAADRMGKLAADIASLEKDEELLAERLSGLDDAAAAWRVSLAAAPAAMPELPALPPFPEPPMALRVDVETLRRESRRLEEAVAGLHAEREALAAVDPRALEQELRAAEDAKAQAGTSLQEVEEALEASVRRADEAAAADRRVGDAEAEANRAWREAAAELERLREAYEQEDRVRADLDRRILEAERLLKEGHERNPDESVAALAETDTPEELERRGELVARRLGLLGRVNLLAQGEFRTLQERHDFLARELDDVKAARRDLLEVVRQVDERIATLFDQAFRDVAAEFTRLFTELFPGGEGRVVLTDPAEPLASGVELEARPGRKRVKRISLLSGGERALTALAFLCAIFRARPSPFYLLDEVEAALDDVNLHRFLQLIQGFADRSQVLLITHQKRTMEIADVLYGVSMRKDGSSAVVAQRLDHPAPAGDPGSKPVVRVPEPAMAKDARAEPSAPAPPPA
jgi:chromosome segregation protein